MIIELNSELTVKSPYEYSAQQMEEWRVRAHRELGYKIKGMSSTPPELVRPLNGEDDVYQRGLMDIASRAYSRHYGLEIGPHNIWYVVLTQLAEQINANAEACRHLFTASAEKQTILVEQDHPTDINVLALIEKVKASVPMDTTLLLPELSTHTVESQIACAAALADALRQYYDYGMFCCGIPRIRLTGTAEDWQLLHTNVSVLNSTFGAIPRMRKTATYLERVNEVLANIISSFYTNDQNVEFWTNIFTQKNVGSGGDLLVNGWLTDLYVNGKPGDMIKVFHDTISILPYTNVSTKESFVMMHGAFRVNATEGEILQAQYDHATFKIDPVVG